MKFYKMFMKDDGGILRAWHGTEAFRVGEYYTLGPEVYRSGERYIFDPHPDLRIGFVGYHACDDALRCVGVRHSLPPGLVMTQIEVDDPADVHREADSPGVVCCRSFRILREVPLAEWGTGRLEMGDGCYRTYLNGLLHYFGDEPSEVWSDGTKTWHYKGRKHRGGGKPAVMKTNGRREYYHLGSLHRVGGPAIVDVLCGFQAWYHNGELYRPEGLRTIVYDSDSLYRPRRAGLPS